MPPAMSDGEDGIGTSSRSLDCRSFWKAGAVELSSCPARELDDPSETGEFKRARTHAKFLHTNASAHKWAFGAIAQILDNSVHEISNGATYVKMDKGVNSKDNSPMLVFQDDGGGMDPEGMQKCISLAFSTKKSKTTIDQYGNGFKISTMRLGADALVFTRAINGSNVSLSVGLLSYTFLRRTLKDDVFTPMLHFEDQGGSIVPLLHGSQSDWDTNLKLILDWSPFSSKEQLIHQFDAIETHGTKVVIYNLWKNDDGFLELDFDNDDEDILLRDEAKTSEGLTKKHQESSEQHISHRFRFSLRAYTSILYLKKHANFQIILRGKLVEHKSVGNDLKFKKVVTYKPRLRDIHGVQVNIEVGFEEEAQVLGISAMSVYHKNRLIMPFWKVLEEGCSVTGVLEANYLETAHIKQDFERTPQFINLEKKLRKVIIDYWKEKCTLIGYQPSGPELRSQHKAGLKDSAGPGPKHHKKSFIDQGTGGHSSNSLAETHDDDAVVIEDDLNTYKLIPVGGVETRPWKLPLYLYKKLRPHQKAGVAWLLNIHCGEIPGGIVADDMGLGKTFQTTAFLAGLFNSEIISRVMIIVPASIVKSWTEELEFVGLDRWFHFYESSDASLEIAFKEKCVLLTTYETYYKDQTSLGSPTLEWDYVVLDEAHRIKNSKALVSMAMTSVKCMKKLLLTGTPLSRDLEDVYALVNFILPDVLGSDADFRAKIVFPIENGKYANSSEKSKSRYLKALARFRKLIVPFLLRRNKSVLIESGDLPCKKNDLVIWLKLTPLQVQLHKNLYKLYGPKKIRGKDDKVIPFALSKLCQLISIDPCLLLKVRDAQTNEDVDRLTKKMAIKLLSYTGIDESVYENVDNSCKMSFVMDLIEKLLNEDEKQSSKDKGLDGNKVEKIKILMYSRYRAVLDLLEKALTARVPECVLMRIDGSMSRKRRNTKIEEFKSSEGPVIFLLSAKVGGEGLTLTAATRLIIVDPSYNISDDNQISDRVYRFGQTKDVFIYRLFTCSTIEEHIYKLQLIKGNMAQAVVDGNVCASLVTNEEERILVLPESFDHSKTYDMLLRELGGKLELDLKHQRFLRKHALVRGITDQNIVFSKAEALPNIHLDESSSEEEGTVHRNEKCEPKRDTQSDIVEQFIKIPGHKAGLLFGNGGSTIIRITRESCARIDIQGARQDSNRLVRVTGTPKETEKARRLIMDIMNMVDHRCTKDARAAAQKVYVPVPREIVGCIIGSSGKRITNIENQSGARVQNRSSRSEGLFEVTGSSEAVHIAQSMILDTIQEARKLRPGASPSLAAGTAWGSSSSHAAEKDGYMPRPKESGVLTPSCSASNSLLTSSQCYQTPRPPLHSCYPPPPANFIRSPLRSSQQHPWYQGPPGYNGVQLSPSGSVTPSGSPHTYQQPRYQGPPGYGVQPSPYLGPGPPIYNAHHPPYPGPPWYGARPSTYPGEGPAGYIVHPLFPGPHDYTVQSSPYGGQDPSPPSK